MFSQMEEQADLYYHKDNPKYPKSKHFEKGELRDVLIIMSNSYGKTHNTHFVVRNAVDHYSWFLGGKHVFQIDDYDSRSYDKENLRTLGWDFDQSGHKLHMDLIWDGWGTVTGAVGDFDAFPFMDIRVEPKGTARRPCDEKPEPEKDKPIRHTLPVPMD
ncbi:hypothetical protein Barb6XT_03160 [Bacteroidales bacterium Barb6XT]|nr:hypothetical protein Barb6XT_03160 [Bacteroidales bacterium Barb6XT]